MNIVIADDDADDRDLALSAFSELTTTHELEFVEDGEQLLRCLEKRLQSSTLPDLVLLDLNMPRKDGREALRYMKANSSLKSIPVIVFSTSTSEADMKYTRDLEVIDYVVKPSGYNELIGVFRGIEERMRGRV